MCLKFTTRKIKQNFTGVFLKTTRDLYWYGNGYCKNSVRITKTFRYWKKIPIHYIWTEPSLHVTKSWNGHWTKDAKWCVKLDMYILESSNETNRSLDTTKKAILHDDDFFRSLYVLFCAWASCNWHIWNPLLM